MIITTIVIIIIIIIIMCVYIYIYVSSYVGSPNESFRDWQFALEGSEVSSLLACSRTLCSCSTLHGCLWNWGLPFWGPYVEDPVIWGSLFGVPDFWKLPHKAPFLEDSFFHRSGPRSS